MITKGKSPTVMRRQGRRLQSQNQDQSFQINGLDGINEADLKRMFVRELVINHRLSALHNKLSLLEKYAQAAFVE